MIISLKNQDVNGVDCGHVFGLQNGMIWNEILHWDSLVTIINERAFPELIDLNP